MLLAASAAHAQYAVTAAWDRNTDALTAGYRLFYGTATGNYQWSVDVGNQVSAPLNLSPGRYYFAVRAYNGSYQYGAPSNEVNFTVGTTTPPTAAIQASLQGANTAVVNWQTTNATSAALNGASVPVNGSTTVNVTATTTFTIVATGAGGATATASATVTITPTGSGVPGPPNNVTTSVSGSRVTLSWRPPSSGGAPTDYLLYVGTNSWGTNVVNARSAGNVLSVSADLPRGTYYARIRARNASGTSRSSSQVSFRIGRRLSTPTGLTATWQGTRATVSWVASSADSADTVPSDYVLEAGTAPGLTDVAVLSLGTATSFAADVPQGVYYVRVRAVNANGDSDPTNDIVVAAPGSSSAPTGLTSSGSGFTVNLSWTPPAAGEALDGYVIEAGSEPGLSDIAKLFVGNVTQFSTQAPPGVYHVRVRAVNSRGAGLPSNEVIIQK